MRVQHVSSSANTTSVTTTLNIGGVSGAFTSTTAADGPCTGCTQYTGTLSAGGTAYAPGSSGFSFTGGTLKGYLRGPAGADFDLYMEKYGSGLFGGWSSVASGTGNTADENVSYSAASGTYRWRIKAYSGSGSYTFWGQPK